MIVLFISSSIDTSNENCTNHPILYLKKIKRKNDCEFINTKGEKWKASVYFWREKKNETMGIPCPNLEALVRTN